MQESIHSTTDNNPILRFFAAAIFFFLSYAPSSSLFRTLYHLLSSACNSSSFFFSFFFLLFTFYLLALNVYILSTKAQDNRCIGHHTHFICQFLVLQIVHSGDGSILLLHSAFDEVKRNDAKRKNNLHTRSIGTLVESLHIKCPFKMLKFKYFGMVCTGRD